MSYLLARQLKTDSADVCGALEAELATQQCRFNACASDLVNRDSSVHELEVHYQPAVEAAAYDLKRCINLMLVE